MRRTARALSSAEAGDTVEVELSLASQCSRCAQGGGCGMGLFTLTQRGAAVRLWCMSERTVRVNEEVIVEFDDSDSRWLRLVLGAYGLPCLGMLVAVLIAAMCLSWVPGLATSSAVNGLRDLILAGAALSGLAGGVFAWRMLAPTVMLGVEKSQCLQSGRIVAAAHSILHPTKVSRSTSHTRENP